MPLRTFVPRKTQFVRSVRPDVRATTPGVFSTGKLSPVSTASLTKQSVASRTTASAGTRLPADSRTTSPGTTSRNGIVTGRASRRTVAIACTRALSSSAAT